MKDTRRRIGRLIAAILATLLAVAVWRELRTPAGRRAWHGSVLGVPYELRPPTLARARERLWSPDRPGVLVPTLFGAGWTVNAGRLVRLLGRLVRR